MGAKQPTAGELLRVTLVDDTSEEARKAGFTFEWESHELAIVDQACAVADQIQALEKVLARDGLTVTGSTGQDRLHPAVTELRQHRALLGSLVGRLRVPDWSKQGEQKSWRHQRAAESRWA